VGVVYIGLRLGSKTMSQNEIETIIGRTDTWACKLIEWWIVLTWIGMMGAFIAAVGWLGLLIAIRSA